MDIPILVSVMDGSSVFFFFFFFFFKNSRNSARMPIFSTRLVDEMVCDISRQLEDKNQTNKEKWSHEHSIFLPD